jgi:hypothetical protein
MSELFKDIIPSILNTKKDVLDEEKQYVPFVVNRALSFHYDCILHANEMNMLPHTDKRMQYSYLLNTVRGYKRPFQKWQKRETIEDLEVIKEYYSFSNEKAKVALSVLSPAQLDDIKRLLSKGGASNVRHKRINRGDATRTR